VGSGVALASESEHYGVQEELQQVYRAGLHSADRVHLQHVFHCASRLGGEGRLMARTLLPAAVYTAQREYPVFSALGLDTQTLITRIRQGTHIPAQLAEAH
jgi:hypothetical protein